MTEQSITTPKPRVQLPEKGLHSWGSSLWASWDTLAYFLFLNFCAISSNKSERLLMAFLIRKFVSQFSGVASPFLQLALPQLFLSARGDSTAMDSQSHGLMPSPVLLLPWGKSFTSKDTLSKMPSPQKINISLHGCFGFVQNWGSCAN